MDNNHLLDVGQRVKAAREALGLSAVEFAQAIEMQGSPQNVYNWERGRSDVPDKYYQGMHRLGINVTWLLTGDGAMLLDNTPGRLLVSEPQPRYHTTTRPVGTVSGQQKRGEGIEELYTLMNVAGMEIKRHSLQLNDHEERLTIIESVIEERTINR